MTDPLTVIGIVAFVAGGIWGNRAAMSVGVALILIGALI